MEKFFEILSNSIVKIENLEHENVPFSCVEIKEVKQTYSKYKSLNLYVDGVPFKGKLRYCRVYWKCRCGRINSSLILKFIHKKELNCQHCLQDKNFGGVGANSPNNPKRGVNKQIQKQNYIFENESDDFKQDYWKTHLTNDEFNKYLPDIFSINDIQLSDVDKNNLKYYEHVHCANQIKYTSKIELNGVIETIKKITFICSICGKEFSPHISDLKLFNSFICGCCKFTNHIYKIKKYKNTKLTYQSSIEKHFIEECLKHKIQIENGLRIKYNFNGKEKTYITDFYLPKQKRIVELKSKNIWYRQDMESGKLQAKNKYATLYANNNDMIFDFLFDYEIDNYIQNITRKR